jgi:hypothetical protein
MPLVQDVLNVFKSKIDQNDGMIVLDEINGTRVSPNKFLELFPVVELSYDSLIDVDPDDEMGYKAFFDKCKAEGILT